MATQAFHTSLLQMAITEIIRVGLETFKQQDKDDLGYRITRLTAEQQEALRKMIEVLEKK